MHGLRSGTLAEMRSIHATGVRLGPTQARATLIYLERGLRGSAKGSGIERGKVAVIGNRSGAIRIPMRVGPAQAMLRGCIAVGYSRSCQYATSIQ
jgi:hypothetical protein